MIALLDDNPTTLRPVVIVALILLCAVAFLWQLPLGKPGFAAAVHALDSPRLTFLAALPPGTLA